MKEIIEVMSEFKLLGQILNERDLPACWIPFRVRKVRSVSRG